MIKKRKTIIGIYKEMMRKSQIKKDHLNGIDITKEYELIKQKKSRLSSAKRKAVLAYKEGQNKKESSNE